jgi:hypothetical protein
MAITLSTKARNAACDAVVALANEGSGVGTIKIKDGATLLVEIPLNDPAFGAASTGVATADNDPALSGTAVAAGDADNYDVCDSDDEVMWSGVVTSVATGTGDCLLQNTSITVDQVVTITSFTHTTPA